MTKSVSAVHPAVFVLCIALVTASCGSARFYKGYDYRGSAQAPDLSGVVSPANHNEMATPGQETRTAATRVEEGNHRPSALNEIASERPDVKGISRPPQDSIISITTRLFEEVQVLSEPGKSLNTGEITHAVVTSLSSSGQSPQLSAKLEKKLQKTVSRMERKMKKQGGEIDWKNNTGLELFFMIMAIAGLVLGILSVGFGWFVFIVFAGLWLFWKLVKDKP